MSPPNNYRVVKGGGPRGGGSLIFPKVPQSSLGITTNRNPSGCVFFVSKCPRVRKKNMDQTWAMKKGGKHADSDPVTLFVGSLDDLSNWSQVNVENL